MKRDELYKELSKRDLVIDGFIIKRCDKGWILPGGVITSSRDNCAYFVLKMKKIIPKIKAYTVVSPKFDKNYRLPGGGSVKLKDEAYKIMGDNSEFYKFVRVFDIQGVEIKGDSLINIKYKEIKCDPVKKC